MDIKKWVLMAVSVITAAVVFGACLPVFADTTQAYDTFTNDGYYRMSKISSSDEGTYIIEWDSATPNIISVNGLNSDTTEWGSKNMAFSIFATETDIFRIGISNTLNISWVQIRGDTHNFIQASNNFEATISNGTATIEYDTAAPITISYTDAYIIDPSNTGAYIMKLANKPAYLNSDSEIYGMGTTAINSVNYMFKITGTIDDPANITINVIELSDTAPDITISDVAIDSEDIAGHEDLIGFNKITFEATPTGGTAETVTYSYVIVPYEVTAEREIHPDGAVKILMDLLPALIGAGLLLGVVAVVIKRRM